LAQGADGRLAMITKQFNQFGDDFGFVFLAGVGIPIPLFGQHFLSCDLTHLGVHGSATSFLSL
jgi:hypothetical protein